MHHAFSWLSCVINTSASDCLERLVFRMTWNALMGTLNLTCSLDSVVIPSKSSYNWYSLHRTSKAAAQCIVISPVWGLWVCYHNLKLRASILTKLGLYVKVVTISSCLNFGRPVSPGRGLRQGEIFWLCQICQICLAACSTCLYRLWALFSLITE